MTQSDTARSGQTLSRLQGIGDQGSAGEGDPTGQAPSARFLQILTLALIGAVLLLAAWLRWRYMVTVQPYPDEFVTLLAVKMVLQKGIPVLPSGLFYEHGLLFSYAGALGSALLGFSRETVRAISLVFGLLTVWLTWNAGRRWLTPGAGLVAATLLAVAPSAVMWGGRARMYTLLQAWVLVMLYLALNGVLINRHGWRYLALVCLLGATLTQFVAITLVPPLVVATISVGWLVACQRGERPWFQMRRVWLEAAGLIGVVLVTFLVKRAGQPKGITALEATGTGVVTGVAQVVAIYAGLSTDVAGSWQALAAFFTAPEAMLPTALALLAAGWAMVNWLRRRLASHELPTLFLALVLTLTTLEMLFLVSPERRDEKYLFMLQPALFLLAADGLARLGRYISNLKSVNQQIPVGAQQIGESANTRPITTVSGLATLVVCLVLVVYSWPATSALLARTGPDYDTAFGYVREHWQEGDRVLTGTPAAAALYLGRNDYYAVRGTGGYAYRILERNGQKVERWIGSPWLETDADLHAVLSAPQRVWLVLERWGLVKEYYSPLTMQRILAMTDFVREDNGVIVLSSRPRAPLIPESPASLTAVNFDNQVTLDGYDLAWNPADSPAGASRSLSLVLYWKALRPLMYDYTVFIHLRDASGRNLAQADHQPLAPVYPPTLWPVGETVRERTLFAIPNDVSSGTYDVWMGLYRLDTLDRLPIVGDVSGENAVLLSQVVVP